MARAAAAHTLPREVSIPPELLFDADEAAQIAVPTLILQGGDTPPGFEADVETVARAVPGVRDLMLETARADPRVRAVILSGSRTHG